MFCRNCGTQNQDGAKFCKGCGNALNQPVQPSAPQNFTQPTQPAAPVQPAAPAQPAYGQPPMAPQPGYGQPQPNMYAPPQNAVPGMGGYNYGRSGGGAAALFAKYSIIHWVALGLMVLSLIGMFTPWITYKIKAADIKESVSFFGLFDSDCLDPSKNSSSSSGYGGYGGYSYDDFDDDDYYYYYYNSSRDNNSSATYLNSYNTAAKKNSSTSSVTDDTDTSRNLMKWFGLLGFLSLIAAIVFGFINPKIMAFISAGSAVMFIVAFISGISCASKLKDAIKVLDGKASIGFGLVITFILVLGACACAFISAFLKKKPVNNMGYRLF